MPTAAPPKRSTAARRGCRRAGRAFKPSDIADMVAADRAAIARSTICQRASEMERARGTRVPLPEPLPQRNVGVAGKGKGNQGSPSGTPPSAQRGGGREATHTARETRAYALRPGPFSSLCGAGRHGSLTGKGQGEPGFPFRNPSLSATWGRPRSNSSGPAKPGLRAAPGSFHPSWCQQAWVTDVKGQGEPGFPFRNPSLSATWGWLGNNSHGPGDPGLRAASGFLFIPPWCRQAWTAEGRAGMDRVLLMGGVAVLVAALVAGGRLVARRRLAWLRGRPADVLWAALGALPDGRPTVVAFS